MSSAFWTWILPIFPEFRSNNSYRALLQRLSLYPKTNQLTSLDLCWFLEEVACFFHSWHLPAIDFSFLTSPLAWCLTPHSYLSIDPSLLVAASLILSHLCGCPLAPKELLLGPCQTQVHSSLISFTSCSNIQVAPDFHPMLTRLPAISASSLELSCSLLSDVLSLPHRIFYF